MLNISDSATVSGSTAVVCVVTEGAASVKSILRDATEQCYQEICLGRSNFMLFRPT